MCLHRRRVEANRRGVSHLLDFGGHQFVALAHRALYWPARRALLVADLHLEQGSWYATAGQMLPPFDSRATLERLSAVVDAYDPAEIWALGDSFHDAAGPDRLTHDERALIERVVRGREMIWIAGNHDAAARLPGDRADEALVGGIILRHDARNAEQRPEISGHWHPKLRLRGASGPLARPCFAACEQRIVLPAFGALTGGFDVLANPLRSLLGDPARALVATTERLLSFALPSREGRVMRVASSRRRASVRVRSAG